MSEFENLQSLYRYLEDEALELISGPEISKLFHNLSKSGPGGLCKENVLLCEWEATAFDVHFEEGDARPADFGKRYDEGAHDYLKQRLAHAHNPVLRSRYSHVLWSIPETKHEEHARTAVESYLELARILGKKALDDPERRFGYHLLLAAGNAYSLAYQIKHRWEEVKSQTRDLVMGFDFASPASFNLRRGLIRLMLDPRKRLKREDFTGVAEVCWKVYQDVRSAGRTETAIEALELGEKVDNRLGTESHEWVTEKAACYEELMGAYRNTPNAFMYCQDALQFYKKAKRWEKVRELEQQYREIKTAMPVATFAEDIDLTEHIDYCKDLARELASRDSLRIIVFLMTVQDLLPRWSELQETVRTYRQETHLNDMLPRSLMDARGHEIQRFSEPNELEYFDILHHYKIHIEVDKLILLRAILEEGFRAGTLTEKSLLDFLREYTWLGMERVFVKPGGRKFHYRWLPLVAPAVHEFSDGMQRQLIGKPLSSDWVLCLDSLIPKLEGMVRELCDSYGITTFCVTSDSKGRKIFKEKDLNALLHEDELKAVVSEDDLFFLKFLLIEHGGYSLRHNIAHCLMLSPQNYLMEHAILAMLALLRLASYQLGDKKGL